MLKKNKSKAVISPKRAGVFGLKSGMISYLWKGQKVAATVIDISNNVVLGYRTMQKDNYQAIRIAYGEKKQQAMDFPARGKAAKANIDGFRKEGEFRVSGDFAEKLSVGTVIGADYFQVGQFVDIRGKTVGKGMAGVVKRYGFGGQEASHGVSISHRSAGSTGTRKIKTKKNRKMAGHMGDLNIVTQNLEILALDQARSIMLVKGCIAGKNGTILRINDSIKYPLPKI